MSTTQKTNSPTLPAKTNQSAPPAKMNNQIAQLYGTITDRGTSSISGEDMTIPRIKIVQPMSTDIKTAIDGIKDGNWYDKLSSKDLGKQIEFYPVMFWKSRIWFSDDQKMLASQYKDPSTGNMVTFGNDTDVILKSPDAGKDSFNYFIVLKDDLERAAVQGTAPAFFVFSMISASIKSAKQLNSKIRFNDQEGLPIWSQLTIATTHSVKFDKGAAWMPLFQYGQVLGMGEDPMAVNKITVLNKFYNTVKQFVSKAESQSVNDGVPHDGAETPENEEALPI